MARYPGQPLRKRNYRPAAGGPPLSIGALSRRPSKKKIRDSEKHVDDPPPLEMRSNCIFFFQTAKFRYCGLPPSVSAICWLHLTPTTNVNHLHKICIKKRSHLCLMFQKLNLNGSTWPSDVTGVSCRHGHRLKTLSSWSKCKCLHRIRINLSRSDHVLHSNAAVCWLSVAVERCT